MSPKPTNQRWKKTLYCFNCEIESTCFVLRQTRILFTLQHSNDTTGPRDIVANGTAAQNGDTLHDRREALMYLVHDLGDEVALADRVALVDDDTLDVARDGRGDRGLHLHGAHDYKEKIVSECIIV